jgi:hypothetical protein
VRNLEIERRNLVFEENLLNIKIAEAESLNNITSSSILKHMTYVDNPKYLVLKDINFTFLDNKNNDNKQ